MVGNFAISLRGGKWRFWAESNVEPLTEVLFPLKALQAEAKSLSLAQCSEDPSASRDSLFTPTPGTQKVHVRNCALEVTWSTSGSRPTPPISSDVAKVIGPARIQNWGYHGPRRAPCSEPRPFLPLDFLLAQLPFTWRRNSEADSRGSPQPAVGAQAEILRCGNSSKSMLAFPCGSQGTQQIQIYLSECLSRVHYGFSFQIHHLCHLHMLAQLLTGAVFLTADRNSFCLLNLVYLRDLQREFTFISDSFAVDKLSPALELKCLPRPSGPREWLI